MDRQLNCACDHKGEHLMTKQSVVSSVMVAAVVMVVPMLAAANENPAGDSVPTFNSDVASIVFENCSSCHRAGQVAPMSLTSYAEVRPWARAIKAKVVSREMPPWFADPQFGHFKDVPTLTLAEIDTIVAWADGGAPLGEGVMPDIPDFSQEWRHNRPPDYVISMPLEIEVPAQGEIEYVKMWVENPWKEDVFLEAVQMRPGNYALVHHAGVHTRALPPGTKIGQTEFYPGSQLIPAPVPIDENETVEAKQQRAVATATANFGKDELLLFYAGRKGFAKYPEGTGKRVYGDRYIVFDQHYQMTGRPEKDRSELGVWFPEKRPHHQVITTSGAGTVRIVENVEQTASLTGSERKALNLPNQPLIPAGAGDFRVTSMWPLSEDITLYGLWPHMHFRGKDMAYLVSYPDGAEEILLSVPNYDSGWQLAYDFVEPKKIPAGSTLKTIAHYDNSVRNRNNPAPDKEVYWSEQTWDEMLIPWVKFSVDKRDLRLEDEAGTQN